MNRDKKQNGYLTVFMSLLLMVMLPLCLLLIESARERVTALETEIAAEIGMDSIMAEYHQELLEQYNLFFLDTSYGTRLPSYTTTQFHLNQYLNQNLNIDDSHKLDGLYLDPLGLTLDGAIVETMSLATDYDGKVFQREVLDAAKNEFGLDLAEELLSYYEEASRDELFRDDLDRQIDDAVGRLNSHNKDRKQLEDKKWYEIEIVDPVEEVWKIRRNGILNSVIEDPTQISSKTVVLDEYISVREKSGEINVGNGEEPEKLTLLEKALNFLYYLKYSGSYLEPKENSSLTYEKEYLLCGKNNDMDNLRETANVLLAIRSVANGIYLASDKVKAEEIKAASELCAAAVFSPELEPVFEAVIFLGWTYMESVYDVKQLYLGGKVPLYKQQDTWHYSLANVFLGFLKKEPPSETGLDYNTYLALLLLTKGEKTICFRFMDLIEMNIRKTPGNKCFRMDGCAYEVGARIKMRSNYGYSVELEKKRNYGE